MNHDPLRRQIAARLMDSIDSEKFQACADDLLRQVYPGIVPIRGGNDAGFDGAIGSSEGQYPVIVTTSPKVLDNVRRNLIEYLARTSGPKRAVVATSQPLTAIKRRNIVQAGKDLGVEIENIHDHSDFVNRLYRDSRWRMELLGLAGYPRALSDQPPRLRSTPTMMVIGRDETLSTIRKAIEAKEDLLLVGQPGSGKTFLHAAVAQEGKCSFVVDHDLGRITDAIREEQPSCIVIDDAHTRIPLLTDLMRFRAESGARQFSIHANCWPSRDDACRSAMGIPSSQALKLEPLTQSQLVDIIHACGVAGPDHVLHMIVEQSIGKPGLAVQLLEACRKGDITRVWKGEALADYLLSGPDFGIGSMARSVLAAFALGGDAGMPLSAVADGLGQSEADVLQVVSDLATGGIVEELTNNRLAVYPSELRGLVTAQVFFRGAASLNPRPLLNSVPSPEATARVLLGARQRDGDVPLPLIEEFVRSCSSRDVWRHFAYVDEECTRCILARYPNMVDRAADGLLHHAPAQAIPALLSLASCRTYGNGEIEDPRRTIGEWIDGDHERDKAHLTRRRQLLVETRRWMLSAKPDSHPVAGWALARILHPGFSRTRQKPGNERSFSMISGVYGLEDLEAIAGLWDDVHGCLKTLPIAGWKPVLDEIETWCLPQRLMRKPSPQRDRLHSFLKERGVRMLSDVLVLPATTRAVRSWVAHIAHWARLEISVETDSDYEALFGERDRDVSPEQEWKERVEGLKALASRLAGQPAIEAWKYLRELEREHSALKASGGTERHVLYAALAESTNETAWWVDALIKDNVSAEYVHPFVKRLLDTNPEAGRAVLLDLLTDRTHYADLAVRLGLALDPLDEEVFGRCLDRASEQAHKNGYWLMHSGLPLASRQRLLREGNANIKAVAALAEWVRSPQHEIRAELQADWRNAVLGIVHEDPYHLGEILERDSALATEWIQNRITSEPGGYLWEHRSVIAQVEKVLSREQRRSILLSMTRKAIDEECFHALLRGDLDLFAEWLDHTSDEDVRLLPLRGSPTEHWISLAIVALDHGVTPEQLAEIAEPMSIGGEGPMSTHYRELLEQYERLAAHPDPRLHETARIGAEGFRQSMERALAEERDEEVYGRSAARRKRLA
ncbi:MAG: ATP-binding protein [Phycisphaeraceae bacterium]|nr:ATP-binding protein [Phycisphaeraceae bacterium]